MPSWPAVSVPRCCLLFRQAATESSSSKNDGDSSLPGAAKLRKCSTGMTPHGCPASVAMLRHVSGRIGFYMRQVAPREWWGAVFRNCVSNVKRAPAHGCPLGRKVDYDPPYLLISFSPYPPSCLRRSKASSHAVSHRPARSHARH